MKKFLFLVMVMVLGLGLVACGEKENETVKIGVIGNLSVAAQFYAEEVVNGVKLAAKQINEAGGIDVNGTKKQIELVIKDDTADPTTAVNQYETISEKVDVIVGPVITGTTLAVSEAAAADGVPMITPSATGDAVTFDKGVLKGSVFRTCFIDSYQGTILAKLSQDKGVKKVVVLKNTSDAYSSGVCDSYVSSAATYGYEVAKVLNYDSLEALKNSMNTFVTEIKGVNPDAVVMPDYTDQIRTAVAACREADVKCMFFGGDGWDSVTTDYAHPEYFENCFYVTGIYSGSDNEKVKSFYADFKAEFNNANTELYKNGHDEVPSMFAALAYDAVYLAKAAIEKAKSVDHEAIVAALKGISFVGCTGSLTFDAKNNPQKSAPVIEFKADGSLTLYKEL